MPDTAATADPLPFALPPRPPVTRIRKVDKAALLNPQGPRTQPLAGFEDRFVDIVDYIIRITDEIWTGRALGYIYDTYDASCTVYSNSGVIRSVEEVVAATAATLTAMPEWEGHHLNVAWSGDAMQGFYTSHLGWTRSVNLGATMWGPATHREIGRRFAADCISRDNRIHTEWLVHDAGAVVRALGISVDEAARIAADLPQRERFVTAPATRMNGQAPIPEWSGARDTPESFARAMFHDLWTRRRLDRVQRFYHPGAVAHSGGGRVAEGLRAIQTLMILIMAAIPDGVMEVEHVCWSEETDGVILAVRWRLTGTTRRGGVLGDMLPQGRLVSMLGISHFRFEGSRIAEEWTVFDEVAAVAQALRG